MYILKITEKQHVLAIHGHRQVLSKHLRLLLYKSCDWVLMRRSWHQNFVKL